MSDSPLYGITRNPWNTQMTTGGSSSGAGAAAALNLGVMHAGMGSAGSIRIPASLRSLRPQTNSRTGSVVSTAPIRTDLRCGADDENCPRCRIDVNSDGGTRSPRHLGIAVAPTGLSHRSRRWRKRLAYCVEPRLNFVRKVDAEVEQITREAVKAFEELGAVVEEANPPWQDPLEIIRIVWLCGSWTELSDVPQERHTYRN